MRAFSSGIAHGEGDHGDVVLHLVIQGDVRLAELLDDLEPFGVVLDGGGVGAGHDQADLVQPRRSMAGGAWRP
jgi:hypothetical protein